MFIKHHLLKGLLILFICLFYSTVAPAQEELIQNLMDTTGMFDVIKPLSGRKAAFTNDEEGSQRRLKIAETHQNSRGIITNASALGYIYLNQGDYTKALQYFNKALKAGENTKSVKAQSVVLAQIGLVHMRMPDYERAFSVFSRSLLMMEEENFIRGIGPVASFAAQCATRLKKYDVAKELYLKSLKGFKDSGDEAASGIVYNLLGELYLINDEYDNAFQNFNIAFSIVSKSGNRMRLAIIQRDIGLVYFKKGINDKAIEYFNKSLALDNQLLVSKLKKEVLMKLFTIYSFNKNFNKADVFHEQYRALKDSINRVKQKYGSEEERFMEEAEKGNIIAMLERKAEEQMLIANQKEMELSAQITATDIERQNKEMALEQLQSSSVEMEKITREKAIQQLDLARKELQLNRQKSFQNILLLILLIIGVLTYFIYSRYRTNKLTNAKLGKANAELALTLDELRLTQDQLINSEKLASLGQMVSGIAHEIKNPLNFIDNFSSLSIDMLNEFKNTDSAEERQELILDIQQNLSKIVDHSRKADGIVKNMLLHSREETQEKVLTNINKLIEESYQITYSNHLARNPSFLITVQYYLASTIPPLRLQQIEIERVIISILENAFYAMLKKRKKQLLYEPVVTIITSLEEKNVCIKISDNADGMPADILKNIFQPFFTTKPPGEGTGLGLSLSYDVITKAHGGSISARSEPGNGTIFTIKMPLTGIV